MLCSFVQGLSVFSWSSSQEKKRKRRERQGKGACTLNPKRHFNGPPRPKLWTTIFSLRRNARTIWILTQSCLLPRVPTPISCFYTESPSARGSYSAQISSQGWKSTGRVSQQTLGRSTQTVHSPPMMQPFWP